MTNLKITKGKVNTLIKDYLNNNNNSPLKEFVFDLCKTNKNVDNLTWNEKKRIINKRIDKNNKIDIKITKGEVNRLIKIYLKNNINFGKNEKDQFKKFPKNNEKF